MYRISDIQNKILQGDIIDHLRKVPNQSVDLIFADPPYFMQTEGKLIRTEGTKFSGVEDEWDKFADYASYDSFCEEWLKECKRVLKKDGTIWVIGAFQNIYRIGYIMQNLGFWILNDVIWSKPNPAPNFKGTRFTNANETMLWCTQGKNAKYTFNYHTMKYLNNGKQMKSVWDIGICIGKERLKNDNGSKAHSTQKPEKLLLNVILSSSKKGDIVLDPFMGSGTTAAVAKLTGRNFIGFEQEEKYVVLAHTRLGKIIPDLENPVFANRFDEKPPRVDVSKLLEKNYLATGELLYSKNSEIKATVTRKGHLQTSDKELSIHKMAAAFLKKENHNGWDFWYVQRNGQLISIDDLRKKYRKKELKFEQFEFEG